MPHVRAVGRVLLDPPHSYRNAVIGSVRDARRAGTSTYRLVNIIRAEPDRYLFEVPSDYTLAPMGIIRKPGPAEGRGGGPALRN